MVIAVPLSNCYKSSGQIFCVSLGGKFCMNLKIRDNIFLNSTWCKLKNKRSKKRVFDPKIDSGIFRQLAPKNFYEPDLAIVLATPGRVKQHTASRSPRTQSSCPPNGPIMRHLYHPPARPIHHALISSTSPPYSFWGGCPSLIPPPDPIQSRLSLFKVTESRDFRDFFYINITNSNYFS